MTSPVDEGLPTFVTEMLPFGYDYICRYRSVRELPAEWAGKKRTKASP
jgi:hypothetical protein